MPKKGTMVAVDDVIKCHQDSQEVTVAAAAALPGRASLLPTLSKTL
jgi:hypothetical protein